MLTIKLKTKLYEIIKSLGYEVSDTPSEKSSLRIKLSLANITKNYFKQDNIQYVYNFKLDIFSDYDGEAEILNAEDIITENIKDLYSSFEEIVEINSNLKLMDDKTTGVIRKHGIINYFITVAGNEKEVADETDTTT